MKLLFIWRWLSALAALIVISFTLSLTSTALAATNVYEGIDCGKAADSAVCQTTGGDPVSGKDGVLQKITLLVAVIAGMAAVIVIVVAGIRFIASNGDAEQVAKSKRAIIFAAVGIVAIVLAETLVTLVLNKV